MRSGQLAELLNNALNDSMAGWCPVLPKSTSHYLIGANWISNWVGLVLVLGLGF